MRHRLPNTTNVTRTGQRDADEMLPTVNRAAIASVASTPESIAISVVTVSRATTQFPQESARRRGIACEQTPPPSREGDPCSYSRRA